MRRKKCPQAKPAVTRDRLPGAMSLAIVSLTIMLQAFVFPAAPAEAQHQSFRLPQLNGTGTLALEDFRGKVVYLDFWASWCGPCRKSLPLYESLYQEMARQAENGQAENAQFTIVAINLDEEEEDAVGFLEKHPVTYPVLLDPAGATAMDWQVKVMPSSFLLDRSGVVVKEYAGFEQSHIEEIRHDIQAQLEIRNSQ